MKFHQLKDPLILWSFIEAMFPGTGRVSWKVWTASVLMHTHSKAAKLSWLDCEILAKTLRSETWYNLYRALFFVLILLILYSWWQGLTKLTGSWNRKLSGGSTTCITFGLVGICTCNIAEQTSLPLPCRRYQSLASSEVVEWFWLPQVRQYIQLLVLWSGMYLCDSKCCTPLVWTVSLLLTGKHDLSWKATDDGVVWLL